MNPYSSNPWMLILKADPARYIERPAPALLAVLKVLEAMFTFIWCFRTLDVLRLILTGRLDAGPVAVLCALLPGELVRLVLPGEGFAAGDLGRAVGFLAGLALLIELVCLTVEGAAAVLLRFGMPDKGAKCFKTTRNWVLFACSMLTACLVPACAMQVYGVLKGGVSSLSPEALRPLIPALALVALLLLRLIYHKSALTVMKAVEYEIRMEFKETGMPRENLCLTSFLLGLWCLGAGGFLIYGRLKARYAPYFLLLALKFFAVWESARFFKKCHR
jgi:hypothetical protein